MSNEYIRWRDISYTNILIQVVQYCFAKSKSIRSRATEGLNSPLILCSFYKPILFSIIFVSIFVITLQSIKRNFAENQPNFELILTQQCLQLATKAIKNDTMSALLVLTRFTIRAFGIDGWNWSYCFSHSEVILAFIYSSIGNRLSLIVNRFCLLRSVAWLKNYYQRKQD